MNNRNEALIFSVLLCVVAGVFGCEQKSPEAARRATDSAQTPLAELPADFFLAETPKGARGVAEIKADESASGEVVVRGRIGGRKEPFVDGAAVFVLADASLKACNELHGDGCKTPWDYCCESRASLAANTATIQVTDADGRPLRMSLNGRGGLTPLATLVIVGDIAQRDNSGVLVINARRIHVEPIEN